MVGTVAYVILVMCVAAGFYVIGLRTAGEHTSRVAADTRIVRILCKQTVQQRPAAISRVEALRDFIIAAASARHESALIDKAQGDVKQAAIDQAAADFYSSLLPRVPIPTPFPASNCR